MGVLALSYSTWESGFSTKSAKNTIFYKRNHGVTQHCHSSNNCHCLLIIKNDFSSSSNSNHWIRHTKTGCYLFNSCIKSLMLIVYHQKKNIFSNKFKYKN